MKPLMRQTAVAVVRPVFAASLMASASILALPAQAQERTWDGTGMPGRWGDDDNWTPSGQPGAGDTAIFAGATPTNIDIDNVSPTIAAMQFNAGAPLYTFSIAINNALTLTGPGIVNNSSQQPTFTNFGDIVFQNGASAGNAIINIQNTGVVSFTDSATAAAAMINNTDGLLEFAGSATAANATISNKSFFSAIAFVQTSSAGRATIDNDQGTIYFSDASQAGSASIVNRNGGSLFFIGTSNAGHAQITNHQAATLFGVTPTDTASAGHAIIDNNDGGTIFAAMTTAGNAQITNRNGGGAIFGEFATAGSATITTGDDSATVFNGNSTGGNAQFITNGTGFVDFGSSVGPNGDGRIGAGSIAGSGIYYIGGGNTLVVGSNNLTSEVTGRIADFDPCGCGSTGRGSLEKVGTGTLILSGVMEYSGTTTVNGGKLVVNTSLSSSSELTVNAGGTIGGSGTLPNTTINGGTLSPGNSIGAITVAGNLALTAASTYLVEVSPTNADRTNVTGTATLGGATVSAMYEPGSYIERRYTILNAAGGRSGTFGSLVNTNLPQAFTASLDYDANNVYLNLAMAVPNFGPGLTVNQTNVANALVNSFNAAGGIPRVYGALTPNGLTQASGESGTQASTAAFQQSDYFLNLMLDPFVTSRGPATGGAPLASGYAGGEADAYAATAKRSRSEQDAYAAMARKAPLRASVFDPRWSVWGAAYGGELKGDGRAGIGSHDATARAYGFAVGADYRLSPDTLVGFAVSGGESRFSLSQNLGSGRADVFQAGAFAQQTIGAGYIKGAMAYGWHDVSTDRFVTAAGIDKLTAAYAAHSLAGRIEGGYRFATPWMGITPYAAGQAAVYWLPGYNEQVALGANTFALSYASKDVSTSRTELGMRADKAFAVGGALLTLRGRAAWAHYYETDRALFASFQVLPASGFTVFGAPQARNVALVSASAETRWRNGFSIAGVFEGEFSDRTTGYAGKGVLRYQW
ncbi:hypothetical protein X566_01635 [Afipia sp. P52-10]|nr:hypothetical protein X566_01635 [Afipia sp. P52-10]